MDIDIEHADWTVWSQFDLLILHFAFTLLFFFCRQICFECRPMDSPCCIDIYYIYVIMISQKNIDFRLNLYLHLFNKSWINIISYWVFGFFLKVDWHTVYWLQLFNEKKINAAGLENICVKNNPTNYFSNGFYKDLLNTYVNFNDCFCPWNCVFN